MVKQIGNTRGQGKDAKAMKRWAAVMLGLGALAATAPMAGANAVWNNTSTNFNASGSWTGGLPSSTNPAVFNAAMVDQPNVSAPITVEALDFSVTGYDLTSTGGTDAITLTQVNPGYQIVNLSSSVSGSTATIDAPLVLGGGAGTTQQMFVNSNNTLNLNGVISGTDGTLWLYGSGSTGTVYNIAAANTYTGDTLISQTTVNLTTGTLGNGSVLVGNYSTAGGTLNATDSGGLGTGDIFVNGGTLNATGGGTLGSGNVTVNLGSLNVNTGTATINNLTLNGSGSSITVAGANGGGLTSGTVVDFAGGRLNLAGNTTTGSTNPTSLTLANPTFNPGGLNIIAVSKNNSSGATTLTIGNTWTRNTGATIQFSNSNGTIVSSPITGANATSTSAILPYATFNNAQFATVNTSGDVVGYGSAVALPGSGSLANTNYTTPGITLAGSESVNSLQIAASSSANTTLDLGGGTLSLTSGGLLLTGGGSTSTYSLTIQNGQLGASNQELILQRYNANTTTNLDATLTGGTGTVTLGGAGGSGPSVTSIVNIGATNTYSGNTYINGGGTIELSATQPLGTGTIYLYNGPYASQVATLEAMPTATGVTLPNAIVIGGETQSGAPNAMTIENNDPNNPFTITGGITGTSGTSNISFTNSSPSANNPIVLSGAASNIAGNFTVTSGELEINADLTVAGVAGGPNLGWLVNKNSTASVVQNSGTVTLGSAAVPMYSTQIDGTYTLNSGALDVYNGVTYTGLRIGYTGTTNTSLLTVNGGALTVESGTNLGNALVVSSNNQGTSNATVIQNGGTVTAGSVQINNGSSSNSADQGVGLYELNGGTLVTGSIGGQNGGAAYGTSTFDFNGGTLQASAANTGFMQGLTTANVQAGGAIINTNSFNDTISQALLHDATLGSTPDGGLTKNGAGTLTLNAVDTYTGATAIASGTLALSATGTIANSSAIDVQSGATFDVSAKTAGFTLGAGQTLEGVGTVSTGGHALTLDGTVAPGDAAMGTLTIDPAAIVDFAAGSDLTINAVGAANDLLAVDGNLNLSGAGDTLNFIGTPTAGSYTIVTYTGTLTGTFTNTSLQGYVVNYGTGSNSAITLSRVPEPATLGLLALGGLGILLLGKRRRV